MVVPSSAIEKLRLSTWSSYCLRSTAAAVPLSLCRDRCRSPITATARPNPVRRPALNLDLNYSRWYFAW
ncbi:hypothetical protein HAX54_046369 [Datura stramonium]|uniref:Uncharacterized protein n=1 Tax=Datura stramonium TaxID=4076 RepID=A0ABS8SR85_DATST|nr:hypothetical protein [Datura stramonium]